MCLRVCVCGCVGECVGECVCRCVCVCVCVGVYNIEYWHATTKWRNYNVTRAGHLRFYGRGYLSDKKKARKCPALIAPTRHLVSVDGNAPPRGGVKQVLVPVPVDPGRGRDLAPDDAGHVDAAALLHQDDGAAVDVAHRVWKGNAP